jgi:hypothetical protein
VAARLDLKRICRPAENVSPRSTSMHTVTEGGDAALLGRVLN